MQIQFLNDGSEYRSYGGGNFSKKQQSSGLFWWTILITLLMGAATFCWFFSIVLFAQPEKPFHYRLLAKVKKLEPLRKFSPLSVPQGKFLGPREVLANYYSHTAEFLSLENDLLKRAFIKNYRDQTPRYVKGEFTVIAGRELTESDVFSQGWVVRARANEIEDVDIEIVFPGVEQAPVGYVTGDKISLDQTSTFASTVHVQKLPSDRLCVTVLPLAYQGFEIANVGKLKMDAPKVLNMDAPWPIARDLDEVQGQEVAAKVAP